MKTLKVLAVAAFTFGIVSIADAQVHLSINAQFGRPAYLPIYTEPVVYAEPVIVERPVVVRRHVVYERPVVYHRRPVYYNNRVVVAGPRYYRGHAKHYNKHYKKHKKHNKHYRAVRYEDYD